MSKYWKTHNNGYVTSDEYNTTRAIYEMGVRFCGGIQTCNQMGVRFCGAIDYVTKWVEVVALKDNSAKSTAWFIYDNIICRFGCPLDLVTDQGGHFINETVEALVRDFAIKQRKFTTYYPRCNGEAESTNKTLKTILLKTVQHSLGNGI